ncbi:MAG: hypothetical protein OEW48_00745 [Phycisphaerae bacterium]|nr:hypothetical protein [Phycisphaerae bacterium]
MYIRVDADHSCENRILCRRTQTNVVADLRLAKFARIAIVRAVHDTWTMVRYRPLRERDGRRIHWLSAFAWAA